MKATHFKFASFALLICGCLPLINLPIEKSNQDPISAPHPFFARDEMILVDKVSEGEKVEIFLAAESPSGGALKFEIIQAPTGMSVEAN